MKDLPKVTIVTPSYNQGRFLERTILSVLTQDYPNIEYIVMDGGSPDNSIDILKKYAGRIAFWASEPDKGQSDAINKGWRMATGKYCSYLNSDDVLAPGSVAKVVSAFLENPDVAMVYGDYTFIDENDTILKKGKGKQTNFKTLLIDGQMPSIAQPSSFYTISEVRKAGYIDESYHLSMDYDLIVKLARNSRIKYIPELISHFRLHTNAKSSTLMKKHWHETLRVKMRYNKVYMLKSILYYLRFRVFHAMPLFFQNFIRRRRNSINDMILLEDSK